MCLTKLIKNWRTNWLIRACTIAAIFLVIEFFLLIPGNLIDHGITNFMSEIGGRLAILFSPKVFRNQNLGDAYMVYMDKSSVYVGDGCNARRVLFLYTAFLLAWPSPLDLRKIRIIGKGLLLLTVFNVIRITVLLLMAAEMPFIFDISHKYIFQTLIYLLMFYLWNDYIKSVQVKDEN